MYLLYLGLDDDKLISSKPTHAGEAAQNQTFQTKKDCQ